MDTRASRIERTLGTLDDGLWERFVSHLLERGVALRDALDAWVRLGFSPLTLRAPARDTLRPADATACSAAP